MLQYRKIVGVHGKDRHLERLHGHTKLDPNDSEDQNVDRSHCCWCSHTEPKVSHSFLCSCLAYYCHFGFHNNLHRLPETAAEVGGLQ